MKKNNQHRIRGKLNINTPNQVKAPSLNFGINRRPEISAFRTGK